MENANIQTGNTEQPQGAAPASQVAQQAEKEETPSLDDLKRAYFGPSNPDAAARAVDNARAICEAHDLPVAFNWDAEHENLPEGYGIGIVPITQRRENVGNVAIGCYIAGIPDPDTVLAHEKGEKWARSVMEGALLSKFANAARPRDGQPPMSLPFSVEDFITSSRGDSGLAFFREHSSRYVKALNDLFRRRIMNATLLRQVLASAKFAEQQFPNVEQAKWEKVLDKMLAEAERENADPGIIALWKRTRDETEISVSDFGLDDLDEALSIE